MGAPSWPPLLQAMATVRPMELHPPTALRTVRLMVVVDLPTVVVLHTVVVDLPTVDTVDRPTANLCSLVSGLTTNLTSAATLTSTIPTRTSSTTASGTST